MSTQKFIKKPIMVEAIQFNGNSNKQQVEAFVGKELKAELESETAYVAHQGPPHFSLLIETKEGVMKAFPGDWVIKEPFPTGDRDFYPCKNEIFQKTYIAHQAQNSLESKVIIKRDKIQTQQLNFNGLPIFDLKKDDIVEEREDGIYFTRKLDFSGYQDIYPTALERIKQRNEEE